MEKHVFRDHPKIHQLSGGRGQLGLIAELNAQLKAVTPVDGEKILGHGPHHELPSRTPVIIDPDAPEQAEQPATKTTKPKVKQFRGRGSQSDSAESQVGTGNLSNFI